MADFTYLYDNLSLVREKMCEAAKRAGVPVPTLVPVTKSGSDDELLALAALGVGDIAENRPQELVRRGALLAGCGYRPRLHEIGTLQTNKVRLILPVVHLIQSVDSIPLAREIEKRAQAAGKTVSVLLEINSAREENKSGVFPDEAEPLAGFLHEAEHLCFSGVMTMGPVCENPEDIRPFFRGTKRLFDRLSPLFETDAPILSMGMSDSFEVGIEEGATLVRVGRRLFTKK